MMNYSTRPLSLNDAGSLDAFLQTIQRQAIRRIYSRCAQDADPHARAASKTPQLTLGIDAPLGTRRGGTQAPRFIDTFSGTIAVNATGANVDHALW